MQDVKNTLPVEITTLPPDMTREDGIADFFTKIHGLAEGIDTDIAFRSELIRRGVNDLPDNLDALSTTVGAATQLIRIYAATIAHEHGTKMV